MKTKRSRINYSVTIYITEVDQNRTRVNSNFVKTFNSTDILSNRKEAISYFELMQQFFLSESNFDFSSPLEAQIKNYKNYKSFSISLDIIVNNENYISLEGDSESLFEFLSYEAEILENNKNTDFIEVENSWGEKQKVLKDNYDLFDFYFNKY